MAADRCRSKVKWATEEFDNERHKPHARRALAGAKEQLSRAADEAKKNQTSHYNDHYAAAVARAKQEVECWQERCSPAAIAEALANAAARRDQAEAELAAAETATAEAAERPTQAEATIRAREIVVQIKITTEFEVGGWDVGIKAEARHDEYNAWGQISVAVEIKPSLGDDYPATLRQMKANRRSTFEFDRKNILVFDRFTATGATPEQVSAIFNASGFPVLQLGSLELFK